MTRMMLDPDVFPVNYIKSKIVEWTKKRINCLLIMAETYKKDQSKFDRILEITQKFLDELGQDTYQGLAKQLSDMKLVSAQKIQDPVRKARVYIELYKKLPQNSKQKFADEEIPHFLKNAEYFMKYY